MQFPRVKPYKFTNMDDFKRDIGHLIEDGAASVLVSFDYFVDYDGIRTQLLWGANDFDAYENLTILIRFPR